MIVPLLEAFSVFSVLTIFVTCNFSHQDLKHYSPLLKFYRHIQCGENRDVSSLQHYLNKLVELVGLLVCGNYPVKILVSGRNLLNCSSMGVDLSENLSVGMDLRGCLKPFSLTVTRWLDTGAELDIIELRQNMSIQGRVSLCSSMIVSVTASMSSSVASVVMMSSIHSHESGQQAPSLGGSAVQFSLPLGTIHSLWTHPRHQSKQCHCSSIQQSPHHQYH